MIVLDTDVVVDVLRGRKDVITRLAEYRPIDVAVSAMTLAELLYGAQASAHEAKNRGEVIRFIAQVHVLAFGRRTADVHARLRWQLRRQPIGPNDLVIAATALLMRATLVTGNAREFERVDGLRVETWRE